jgi:hypothetical protein
MAVASRLPPGPAPDGGGAFCLERRSRQRDSDGLFTMNAELLQVLFAIACILGSIGCGMEPGLLLRRLQDDPL